METFKLTDYVVGEIVISKSYERIIGHLNKRLNDYKNRKIKVCWTIENNDIYIKKYEE